MATEPAATTKPTFIENLNGQFTAAWDHVARLDAREVVLNFGLSAAVVLLALGVIWLLGLLFDRLIAKMERDLAPGEEPKPKATRRVAGFSWLLLRLVVMLAALLSIASVWGIDPWAWLRGHNGVRILRLAVIVLLVTSLVEAAGYLIRRVVGGVAGRSRDPRRAAQINTLGPLLTGSVQSVLVVVGLLTFLSEVGVQVAPLLASAGVVGIAVGFGAQTLVKDFLTGIFLIAEDVVSVGDVVTIGSDSGTVEAMTLRTIRLRSLNGVLHIFPYSEAQVIHNHSKDFSAFVFDMVVAYTTDLDQALGIMRQIGEDLANDRKYGPMMLQPCDILGVEKLSESGVLLKAKITTRPKQNMAVGREYNRRVKAAFDAVGIQSPYTSIEVMAPPKPPEDEAPAPPKPARKRKPAAKG